MNTKQYICMCILMTHTLSTLPQLHSLPRESRPTKEPIIGEFVQEIPLSKLPSAEQESPIFGLLKPKQFIRIDLSNSKDYMDIQLQISPVHRSQDSLKSLAANVIGFTHIEKLKKKSVSNRHPIRYLGRRLLTKRVSAQNMQFELKLEHLELKDFESNSYAVYTRKPGASYARPHNPDQLTIPISAENTTFCIGILPLNMQNSIQSQHIYQYEVRFRKKNYAFVAFQVQYPVTKRAVPQRSFRNLSLLINQVQYPWFSQINANNHLQLLHHRADSQIYRLQLGEHHAQVKSTDFSGEAKFYLQAGEFRTIYVNATQVKPSLLITVPEGTHLLLDGRPIQHSTQAQAPIWQNVKVKKIQKFIYTIPRIQYSLQVSAGKHQLLIQYEGQTWKQDIFLQENQTREVILTWDIQEKASP